MTQKSKPGAVFAYRADVPDGCVPFGDGRSVWHAATQTLYNLEACKVATLVVPITVPAMPVPLPEVQS